MKFRKKPVVIEAVQWKGDNIKEVLGFTGINESAENLTVDELESLIKKEGLKIFTLEGTMKADINDWIIVAPEFM